MSLRKLQSPLRHLDVPAVSNAARVESRRRETHLPPVSVFRWWARRTESVVGAVVEAFNTDSPGSLTIADPFAGGGTIAFAAARRGHTVYAQDVNPWAVKGLETAFRLPTPGRINEASEELEARASDLLEEAYTVDGATAVRTIRVSTGRCPNCDAVIRLFPTGLVSLTKRFDTNGKEGWAVCQAGHIQPATLGKRTKCTECRRLVDPGRRFTAGKIVQCAECRRSHHFSELTSRGRTVVMLDVMENGQRIVRPPTSKEAKLAESSSWKTTGRLGTIPSGDETARLLRAGYTRWEELYPARQLHVTEQLLGIAAELADGDGRLKQTLELAIVGTTEFAGHASRWDNRYLKPYETIANHRFEDTTLNVEPHVWGVPGLGRGTVSSRLAAMIRAAEWSQKQMPHRRVATRKTSRKVPLAADTTLVAGPSQSIGAPDDTFDLVLTDPPYHDDVQYAELSWLFQAWSGSVKKHEGDLTVGSAGCATSDYRSELTKVFEEIRRTLKTDGHLILSYANRNPAAWIALIGGLQDAGFQACGYLAVHAENEEDHAKRGRRATTMDLLVDVVPEGTSVERFEPVIEGSSDQHEFLREVSKWVSQTGSLGEGWEASMREDLLEARYLQATRVA